MRLIDSHCHLDFPEFDRDRGEVISSAAKLGVEAIVVPGVRAATWPALLALCADNPSLFPALGLHPYFVEEHQDEHLSVLTCSLETNPERVVAVGEAGLDARMPNWGRQLDLLESQLALAKSISKPIILHSVKAHETLIARLKMANLPRGGVVHAFSGSFEQAIQFFNLGFKLGVGGVITYARAHKTREAIRRVPLEALVLETDSPDMPLQGFQGQRNSPEQIPRVFGCLKALRAESNQVLERQLWANTLELFQLSRSLHENN